MTRRMAAGATLVVLLLGACAGAASPNPDHFVEVPGIGSTRIDVPRPTTKGDECAVALRQGESMAVRVAAFRAIGLFADKAALSDEALAREVEAGIAEVWGSMEPDEPLLDLYVAEQDATRVWWHDLEADVADGGDSYIATLQEWATISVGAFAPSSIEETWESDAGPVKVRFELGGARHELSPEHLDDWIDPRIAGPINELIAPTGRQFTFLDAFDQTAFLMALTDEERDALEARGWCFD